MAEHYMAEDSITEEYVAENPMAEGSITKDYIAVIQAGGKGTRMEEITGGKIPKPMILLTFGGKGERVFRRWEPVGSRNPLYRRAGAVRFCGGPFLFKTHS